MMKQVFQELIGDARIVIVEAKDGFRGAVFEGRNRTIDVEGDDLERLKAQLRNEAGKLHPNYYGISGARDRFLHFFREGFAGEYYQGKERAYKVKARDALVAAAPLEAALKADAAIAAGCRKTLSTNMLSTFEAARLSELLLSREGPAFVRAAAEFTVEPNQAALHAMEVAIRPHGRTSWPLVTYLPFLWKPEHHMFLKPTATLDFAVRTGHHFPRVYTAEQTLDVYEGLLDLVDATASEIADLGPIDRIDIQSFIWVVGSYREADYEPN